MQSLNRRTDDAAIYLLHKLLVGEWNGRNGTHTACVEAYVSLANALVVFRYGKHLIVFAVGQDKDRALNAIEKLLNDNRLAGIAKHTAQHVA